MDNNPCAIKECLLHGTVFQFYHRAQENVNKDKFFCLDCIKEFRSQVRARKNRYVTKSKKPKDIKYTCKLLGITEEVYMGLITSVTIDDPANGKLFYADKHFSFVFSIEFLYQLLSSTQRLAQVLENPCAHQKLQETKNWVSINPGA